MNNEKLQEIERMREAQAGKIKYLNIYGFGALGLALVLFFVGANTNLPVLMVIAIILAVTGLPCIIIAAKKKAEIVKMFKEQVVPGIIKEVYPDSTYDKNHGFNYSKVDEPGFFKDPDRFYSSDLITGTFEGVPFEFSAIDLQERHESTDSDGHTTVTYVSYVKGKMVIIDFKRDIQETVKVVETKMFGSDNRGLHKIQTESIEFNKKFTTLTSNDLATFYILTPQIQLKLLELEKQYNGTIFFSFFKGKFYVVVNDSKEVLDVKVTKDLNEQVDKIVSEISLPAALISELKFSSDKWNDDSKVNF